MKSDSLQISGRIRLAEFSLLMAVLGRDPSEFTFLSQEAQGGHATDIATIRRRDAETTNRQEQVISAYLPSFKNYFPDSFLVEEREESEDDPEILEDKTLNFWSAFDTTTYRFWIWFHILKLRMLLASEDTDTELLFWARLGGEVPAVAKEERKYLLLLRFYAPFFRGRRLLYERVLPAFIKKQVTVEENIPRRVPIPETYRSSMGKGNARLGRNWVPGKSFVENYSTFRVNIIDLDRSDVADFRPGGIKRKLLNNLMTLFTPAHLVGLIRYRFTPAQKLFTIGAQHKESYLGFSTYLKETV